MSAPAGINHAARWQAWTATWSYLLADEPATTDTAGSARPLRAGDQSEQHEAAPSPGSTGRRFKEVNRREPLTTADA
jgi:hypothetical protein